MFAKRFQHFAFFIQDKRNLFEIIARARKLTLGFQFSCLKLGNSGSFFEYGASVLRLCGKKFIHSALPDNRIALSSHTRIAKIFGYIFKTTRRAVYGILAFTRTIEFTRNNHFVVVESGKKFLTIIKHKRNFAIRHRFSFFGAVKNNVLHGRAAQQFCRLFSEHPANRIGYVAFSATVRSDYRSNTAFKRYFVFIRKRLEAVYFNAFQFQNRIVLFTFYFYNIITFTLKKSKKKTPLSPSAFVLSYYFCAIATRFSF